MALFAELHSLGGPVFANFSVRDGFSRCCAKLHSDSGFVCGIAQLEMFLRVAGYRSLPAWLDSKPGDDVFGNMSGTRPRGSVGVAWQAMKEARLRSVETAITAEKVVTGKSDVVNVAVEKTATEFTETVVVEQAERNVSSVSAQADGTVTPCESNVDKDLDGNMLKKFKAAEVVNASIDVDTFTFQWVS